MPPHTIALFDLSISKIKRIAKDKTYYVQFFFTDKAKNEITRKAVELVPLNNIETPVFTTKKIRVTQGESITIEVGDVSYVFNSNTGHLASAALKDKSLISELIPTLWDKLDHGSTSVIGNKLVRSLPDLNKNKPSVNTWKIREDNEKVIIEAKVNYEVNDTTSFLIDYHYTVLANGELNVRYQIETKVGTPSLPVVGMAMKTAPPMNDIHWFGLGPWDAYPNKRSAPILGVWGGVAGSDDVIGNKAIRWVKRSGVTGCVKVLHTGYMRHKTSSPDVLYILSEVLSKPEKGRKPDESFPLLLTNNGEPFIGEFTITLTSSNK